MNEGMQQRRKLMWLLAALGALLVAVVVLSLAAPSPRPVATEPVVRAGDATTVAGDASLVAQEPEDGSGGFSLGGAGIVSLAWRLGLVVVIIAASVAGLRWWGRRAAAPRSQLGYLRVVDTLPVSGGRAIHLVALGERVIAVGATAQQLSFLAELETGDAAELLARLQAPGESSISGFASELMQSLQRVGQRRTPVQPFVIGEDYP